MVAPARPVLAAAPARLQAVQLVQRRVPGMLVAAALRPAVALVLDEIVAAVAAVVLPVDTHRRPDVASLERMC